MQRMIFLSLLLAAAARPLQAQTPQASFPGTPLGGIARSIIAATDQGDSTVLAQALERGCAGTMMLSRTPAYYENILLLLHRQSEGLEVMGIDSPLPGDIRIYTRARNGKAYLGLEIEGTPADPDHVSMISFHPIDGPPGRRKPPAWPVIGNDADLARAVRERTDSLARADAFSGVVVLAHGDSILLRRAWGMADRERGVPNTPATRFGLTSVGKMFTAVAVAQLVEQGSLQLDDTLAAILPEFRHRPAAGVTVRQLLNHTAGMPEIFDAPGYDSTGNYPTARSLLPLLVSRPLTGTPGERWAYSNGGYAVLAAVVEAVSGETFGDYLRQRVFAPAAMRPGLVAADTTSLTAVPYARYIETDPLGIEPRVGRPVATPDALGRHLRGFGGSFGSADDLFRFVRALREGKLVSRGMLDSLVTGNTPIAPGAPVGYGYGFYDAFFGGNHIRGHSGSNPGTGWDADVEMIWETDYSIIVLSNYDAPAGTNLARQIAMLLSEK